MATLTAPVDGRRQYGKLIVMLANGSLGRAPFAGTVPVGYGSDLYMLAGSWPVPTPTTNSVSPSVATQQVPEAAPRSAAAALALWPNLS
jgi:hypothetical protein